MWFVVEDVVLALIDSKDPKQYIQRMKRHDPELGKGWVQIVHILSIRTVGGALTDSPDPKYDGYLFKNARTFMGLSYRQSVDN